MPKVPSTASSKLHSHSETEPGRCIEIRGARQNNLQNIDVDVPLGKLVAICGVSGSGKSSLAIDTLYAEGQRRYIASFSAYTRQYLDQLEKPRVERISHLPPAVGVTRKGHSTTNRSTVGTRAEILDYLRLLYARVGQFTCPKCGNLVQTHSPEQAADAIVNLPAGKRLMLVAEFALADRDPLTAVADISEDGFVRGILNGESIRWADLQETQLKEINSDHLWVVIDRLKTGDLESARLRDSLETAYELGDDGCLVLLEADGEANDEPQTVRVDNKTWQRIDYSRVPKCCGQVMPPLEPALFDFNNALGACPLCEGFGDVVEVDMNLVIPDPAKSLRKGAIAAWNTPAYNHELEELVALAGDYEIDLDAPWRDLDAAAKNVVLHGTRGEYRRDDVPAHDFGGLDGFFAWLERNKYKVQVRAFLSRWRSYRTCPDCGGARLRPESLTVHVAGLNFAEVLALRIDAAAEHFAGLSLDENQQQIASVMLSQIRSRLNYLCDVGVGYLAMERPLRTLSTGELQRVALTSALGSSLVHLLYVLDEPSVGLHPADVGKLTRCIEKLRDRGNTVVMIEHEEEMLAVADHLIEIGPGAGTSGGDLVFEGSLEELKADKTVTADFLAGRRGVSLPEKRRQPNHGKVILKGARGRNLQNLHVEFPLGLLCLVTGVSGSGKSTLVQDTLARGLIRRITREGDLPLEVDQVLGEGQIDEVVLIDQSPLSRSSRSNPVTYVKAFDEIRKVMAETPEAKLRNFKPGHFSFNGKAGRCETCEGEGQVSIDMQFLADINMRCPDCHGTRFKKEILTATHRGKSIADILDMTVREAFGFFRGHHKVQTKLKSLIDVGLEYLALGQASNTLSGGEAQRLKLAGYVASTKRSRTLFIMDEPTTGLHFADVVKLLDCFEALLEVGHSLIVVEHNVQLMRAADYIIDLGPGAGEAGGQVVATGTPEEIAANPSSATGRVLAASGMGKM